MTLEWSEMVAWDESGRILIYQLILRRILEI